MMHFILYKDKKLRLINEELGLENPIETIRDEEEINRLRKEMELKREIIREEKNLETIEVIRNLFKDEENYLKTGSSRSEKVSNYPSLFKIGLSLLILGSFELIPFCFTN